MVEPMVDEKGELMEPELHFHEFLFLLGLIARSCILQSPEDTIQSKLAEFFVEKLNLKKVSHLSNVDLSYEDVLHRVYNFDQGTERMTKVEGESVEEDEWESGESDEDNGVSSN